jgi:hypothetical protein
MVLKISIPCFMALAFLLLTKIDLCEEWEGIPWMEIPKTKPPQWTRKGDTVPCDGRGTSLKR